MSTDCVCFRLLLYGVVCTLLEKHETAETFFEAATCVQPRSILAWTMLGLYKKISIPEFSTMIFCCFIALKKISGL